jgi:hypothetical protein
LQFAPNTLRSPALGWRGRFGRTWLVKPVGGFNCVSLHLTSAKGPGTPRRQARYATLWRSVVPRCRRTGSIVHQVPNTDTCPTTENDPSGSCGLPSHGPAYRSLFSTTCTDVVKIEFPDAKVRRLTATGTRPGLYLPSDSLFLAQRDCSIACGFDGRKPPTQIVMAG